jgi:hypothetical protein
MKLYTTLCSNTVLKRVYWREISFINLQDKYKFKCRHAFFLNLAVIMFIKWIYVKGVSVVFFRFNAL